MKRILLSLIAIFSFSFSYAQTTVFHEDFEVVDSVTSSGNPTWFQQAGFYTSPTHCMRDTCIASDSSYLTTTNAFSTLGNNYILLHFNHICKIDINNAGTIEVSNDNGSTWTRLTAAQYLSSSGFTAANKFTAAAYSVLWHAGGAGHDTITPTQAWWKSETFDISSFTSNAAQVKVRFKLKGSIAGNNRNYGWLVDDINVVAAPHELIVPHIAWSPPFVQGIIYSLNPTIIADTITDASGIDSISPNEPKLTYTVNSGAPQVVSMTRVTPGGNIWHGTIPGMSDSDTVCYYVQAKDIWLNSASLPITGCITYIARAGITFPYSDNFDASNPPWTDSSGTGTHWQLGTPNFGATNSVHSAPNAWDINLNTAYNTNARCNLLSPIFDFSGVYNAKLSVWNNYSTSLNEDGAHIEYSTNSGNTWKILGHVNDPQSTNWYDTDDAFGPIDSIWTGNSGGWHLSTYRLSQLNNAGAQVQLKFVFASTGFTSGDGISIDDFSINLAAPQDVGVSAILNPGSVSAAGSSNTVKVVLTNFGALNATNFNISYSVNGGPPVSQLYSGTLTPIANDTVTFTTPFLAPLGLYNLCSYTGLVQDGDHSNDTICQSSHGVPLFALPYTDNFDTGASVWIDSSLTSTQWQLGTPNFGVTNSAFSAPNSWDINLSTTYGNNARSYLISPLFDFTGQVNPKLSFWMNRNINGGQFGDGVYLEYTVNGATTWQPLGIVGDPNALGGNWYTTPNIDFSGLSGWDGSSGGWVKYTYVLGPPFNNAGPGVQFRFVFVSNFSTPLDGVSIDDFAIIPASPVDLAVTSITQPGNSAAVGSSANVGVTLTNLGSNTLTTANISYVVNGVLTATEPWTGTLAPSGSTVFNFATPFTVPLGIYDLCAYGSATGDGDHSNDTICATRHGIPLFTLPYFDNFDTGAVAWIDSSSESQTHWELGTPNFGQTTGTLSPPNCWDINLNTSYAVNARSYLTSPFFDFTGIFNARLTFWQNYNTETFWDGTRLEYSTDGGGSWQTLGTIGDPLATRWYTNVVNSSAQAAWAGMSVDSVTLNPGWIKSTYKLVPLNNAGNQVMLRFVFTSDGSVNVAGESIDNFKIVPPSPFDASVLQIIQPGAYAPAGVSSPVRVIISNEGGNPISNFDVSYSINAVVSGTLTYTGTLQPGDQDTVAFPPFVFPTGAVDICAYTQLAGDGDHTNDTLCKSSFGIPTKNIPYFDDFEGANNFFSPSPTDWQFGVPTSPIINSAFSPVTVWKTNLSGQYVVNEDEYLYSPFFDFTGAYEPELKFWHWFETETNFDGGRVDISTDGGLTWNVLGSFADTSASNWYNDNALNSSGLPAWMGTSTAYVQSSYRLHQLSDWHGGYVQFRFNFSSDGSIVNDGWAIDNFEIFSPSPNVAPIALSPIINPFLPSGSTQADSVKILNHSAAVITDLDVVLSVDGSNISSDHITYSPPLSPGTSRWYTFSTLWHATPGGHQICVATANPNGLADVNPHDDTLCYNGGVFDSSTVTLTTSYCNDFEGGEPQLIPMNAITYNLYSTDWTLGTPNKSIIHTAHSGSKAWMTNLVNDYPSRDSSGLFTPVFAVDTAGCYELSFWHNFVTEDLQDGGTVEYSIDGGTSWTVLGFAYEANWYNALYITGLTGPPTSGWSGNSQGWIQSSHLIRFANTGHVIFRLRFGSDLTHQEEGWAIDDMCFKKVAYCIIGIDELTGNSITLDQCFPNPASEKAMISYSVPEHGKVRLYLTDVLGRTMNELVNESQSAGSHQVNVNVKNLADGMYYYTLEFNNQKMVRKLVVTH